MKKLSIIVLFCLLCAATHAQSGRTGRLRWNISNATLTITGTRAMPNYSISSVAKPNSTPKIVITTPWWSKYDSIFNVIIDEGVTNIGNYAFGFCRNLQSVTIPNSVTKIGKNAFMACSRLYSVIIPNKVINIGDNAFDLCRNLTSVSIGNSVTSIGNHAFGGCSSLTSIIIPNSVKNIGNSAFVNCSKLTSITIPNSVISIGGRAFADCLRLTSVNIGISVTSIGEEAFGDCRSLSKIVNHATKPQRIKANVFKDVNITACTLQVPAVSVNAYRKARVWKEFQIEGF